MKKLTTILVLFLIAAFLPLPSQSLAATKVFEREYTYQASEIDSKRSCRIQASSELKRILLEEIGVYLETYTEVKNFQLSKDKIIAITAGIIQYKRIGEKFDGEKYWVKARMVVDLDDLQRKILNIGKDRQQTKLYEKLKAENERLRNELQTEREKGSKINKKKYEESILKLAAINHTSEGFAYLNDDELEKALSSFTKAIELDPLLDKAFEGKSMLYVKLQKYSNAISAAGKAIELNPQNPFMYKIMAVAYVELRQLQKALDQINKAIDLESTEPVYYCYRGLILGTIGEKHKALKNFQTAMKISPMSPNVYTFRGTYYRDVEKNYQAAISDYNKAIELDPLYGGAYWARGVTLGFGLGHYHEAISSLNEAIKLRPKNGSAYLSRAVFNEKLQKDNEAIKDYTNAIDYLPDGGNEIRTAYTCRSTIYLERGMYDNAIKDLAKLINMNPQNGSYYSGRGYAYIKLGNTEKAMQDFSRACKLGIKSACNALASIEFKKKQYPTKKKNQPSTCLNLRIFQAGDYINYKLTGFVNVRGVDIPIFGTVHYEVLNYTQADYYGKPCKICRMSFDYTATGRDRSHRIVMFFDQYFAQDEHGSIMLHGEADSYEKKQVFVKTPSTGWHFELKCPMNIHESFTQNVVYSDGSSANITGILLGKEEISCPAGNYLAIKSMTNTNRTNPDKTTERFMDTIWFHPQIGPVRMNLELSNSVGGHKFILEMTDTNIPYRKN